MNEGIKMKFYRTSCNLSYEILNSAPRPIDQEALYVIVAPSSYYDYCSIIQRADGKSYMGSNRWIVPTASLFNCDLLDHII